MHFRVVEALGLVVFSLILLVPWQARQLGLLAIILVLIMLKLASVKGLEWWTDFLCIEIAGNIVMEKPAIIQAKIIVGILPIVTSSPSYRACFEIVMAIVLI